VRTPASRLIRRKRLARLRGAQLLFAIMLSSCTSFKPPQISYDDDVPPSPDLPMPADDHARPLHVPPSWTPTRGGKKGDQEAKEPTDRIGTANDAARVEPRRAGYFNAVQVFPLVPGRSIRSTLPQGRSRISRSSRANSSQDRGRSPPATPSAGSSVTPKAATAIPGASISW
jgi:hypothetical protein